MIIIKTYLLVLLFFISSLSQTKLNEYGLYVVTDISEYNKQVEQDSLSILVELDAYIPGIIKDVKYAASDNFLGEVIYPSARIFLRKPAAEALKNTQKELKKNGLELKIYDAYRPYSVTVKMYKTYKDTTYVASAWTGSRHNRGCAVDLTLISNGEEVLMPTGYDDFTEKAHPDYNNLPKEAIKNRDLLRRIMEENGFTVYPSEWWHFDFVGWEKHPLMDLSFDELNNH